MVDVVVNPGPLSLEIDIPAPEVHGVARPAVQALAIAVQSPVVLVDGNTPNIKSLLPLSATAQERALERTTARIGNIKTVAMRTSWDADTCPSALLPWLAWAVSVDAWDASWTDEQKRGSIRNSFLIHKSKGTLGALRRALAAVSFSSEVIEWFNDAEPEADPYTFRLEVFADDIAISDAVFNQIIRIVEETKNVRSHMRRISAVTRIRGNIFMASAMFSGVRTEVFPFFGGIVDLTGLMSLAGCVIFGDIVTIGEPEDDAELPAPPTITSDDTVGFDEDEDFSYFITATGSPTSYSADGLPAWLDINNATGEISGTYDDPGIFVFVVKATNAGGTGSMVVTLTVGSVAPVIDSDLTYDGVVGDPFSYFITVTPETSGPVTYGAIGLPSWATLDTSTGEIYGTPDVDDVTDITITATNAGGMDSETLSITIEDDGVLADLSAVNFNGDIYSAWLDRANYKLYIAGGGTSVTDASGTHARSNACCLDLMTGLFTSWAPVLTGAQFYIYGTSTWIYISGGATTNGGVSNRPQRVDKTTGTTNDATFVASDFHGTNMVSDGSNIWAGPVINPAIAPSHLATYKVTSTGGFVGFPFFVASPGVTIANGCAPVGFSENGDLFGACQANLPPGPPYRAHGIFRANEFDGEIPSGILYGVSGDHGQISDGGKAVITGVFTNVLTMSLGIAYAAPMGIAILNESLTSSFPFSVTFTRTSWSGTINGCCVDHLDDAVFIAGETIDSVEGDSSRKTAFKVAPGGTLDTTFNPSFSAAGIVRKGVVIDDCVIFMGTGFGDVNGVSRPYFAALRTDTGATYTG